jgi:hypothetical protein
MLEFQDWPAQFPLHVTLPHQGFFVEFFRLRSRRLTPQLDLQIAQLRKLSKRYLVRLLHSMRNAANWLGIGVARVGFRLG